MNEALSKEEYNRKSVLFNLRGSAYFITKDYDKAIGDLELVDTNAGISKQAIYEKLVEAYFNSVSEENIIFSNFEKALEKISELKKLECKLNDTTIEIRNDILNKFSDLALEHYNNDKFDEAIKYSNVAYQYLKKDNLPLITNFKEILAKSYYKKDHKNILKDYEKALEYNPNIYPARLHCRRHYFRNYRNTSNNLDSSIKDLTKTVKYAKNDIIMEDELNSLKVEQNISKYEELDETIKNIIQNRKNTPKSKFFQEVNNTISKIYKFIKGLI